MAPRPLGNTGLLVSPIGLGTVKLGRATGLNHATTRGTTTPATTSPALPDDEQVIALLAAARDLGINLIDTSPAYGTSEERLGTLLPRVAPRDRWVICTKAGETFSPAGGPDGRGTSTYDFSPTALRASIERSLARLRTDHLDIVLLHFAGSLSHDAPTLREGAAVGELRRLQAQGKIRAVGASTGTPQGAMLAVGCCDVVMLTINTQHKADLPAAALAHARGVGVLVKKALASGRLATTPGAASEAVAFASAQPGATSVIVGTTNPAHLRDAAAAHTK